MVTIATVGLDLAKIVFQAHCVEVSACLIGMKACGAVHPWGRELLKLDNNVKLMPPAYVKRGKMDAADAEAVTQPTMRFVAVKSVSNRLF
jgi:transposase